MEDLFKICGIVNLKKGEGRTIKAGGMWVYDNEIESIMGDAPDGTLVEVHDFDGYFMGIGFINRRSKLTVRMMSRHQHVIDEDFIEQRVRDCVEYRKHTVDMSSCRLVFGEADFLPGIVIDKFSDVLVVESLALGIDRFKPMIVDKLKKVLAENGMNIRGVYERSDAKVRLNEGLERFKGFIGEEFDTKVMIEENGVKYYVDVQDGQKTGFFLDQKYNRKAIWKICPGAKVLDCFTHTGSFALNAGMAGAASVLGVDASELGVEQARENAKLNGLEDRVSFVCRDVFELLPELEKMNIGKMEIPVYTNVTAETLKNESEIVPTLAKQVVSPVRWEHIIKNMYDAGADTFIELGPGKTLCGFVKRTVKGVVNVNVEDTASLEKALKKIRE